MMPVRYVEEGDSRLNAEVAFRSLLTEDIEFGQASKYLKTQAEEGVTVLVRGDDDVQSPLVAFRKLGSGYVVWWGFFEEYSTFALENTYPVFWKRMLDFVTNKPDVNNLNYATGTQLSFDRPVRVGTPGGLVESGFIGLDDAGLYEFPDRVVAATLRSDRESNVVVRDEEEGAERVAGDGEQKAPYDLTSLFLFAALGLLFFELVYIKLRGDC
ncbi:MAG: hypothetical protein HC945_03920 [Nitrosarchaeum sp.]|nr:hypothetical protein [Nitrosarchaeum sp.]